MCSSRRAFPLTTGGAAGASLYATMKLPEPCRRRLIDGLIAVGWSVEDGFLYAPRRTFWLQCDDPWTGDLADMLERMRGRLHRIRNSATASEDPTTFQDAIDDTSELVEVLNQL
jgi:hypothetical protein